MSGLTIKDRSLLRSMVSRLLEIVFRRWKAFHGNFPILLEKTAFHSNWKADDFQCLDSFQISFLNFLENYSFLAPTLRYFSAKKNYDQKISVY